MLDKDTLILDDLNLKRLIFDLSYGSILPECVISISLHHDNGNVLYRVGLTASQTRAIRKRVKQKSVAEYYASRQSG